MKRFACVLMLCAACGSETDLRLDPARDPDFTLSSDDVLPAPGLLRTSYSFTIRAGKHGSNHDFVARPHIGRSVDRALRFTATFPAGVAYTTANPANQSDWNKLMGLTTDRIHKNSIRVGWRWNPKTSRVELGFYGYLDGAREMPMLTDVAPGQSIDCELQMKNAGLTARCGSFSHTQSGSMGVSFPTTWVLHSAYFGGDETAPHDIHVDVTNISAN